MFKEMFRRGKRSSNHVEGTPASSIHLLSSLSEQSQILKLSSSTRLDTRTLYQVVNEGRKTDPASQINLITCYLGTQANGQNLTACSNDAGRNPNSGSRTLCQPAQTIVITLACKWPMSTTDTCSSPELFCTLCFRDKYWFIEIPKNDEACFIRFRNLWPKPNG